MRRLALYSFYSKYGSAGSFVYYYIRELLKSADVVFLANGILSADARTRLEEMGCQVRVRDNKGFDFGAWKDFLLSEDASFYSRYDEIILCNSSCYGPVFPFSVIFDEMESRSCDFWGLYRNPGSKERKRNIPPHIQSYFLVLGKKLFSDRCFRDYFSGLAYAGSWEEAVRQEVSFTGYFEERGFVSSSYLGSSLSKFIEDPTILMPAELLEQRFPLIKRKCFTADYSYINKISSSAQIRNLLCFLRAKTDYPADLIYEDLLSSEKNSNIIRALGLSYVLESDGDSGQIGSDSCRIAAVLCSSIAERIHSNIRYLKSLPDGSSVFIAAVSEKIRDAWTAVLSSLGNFRVEVRLQEEDSCPEAAFWLTFRDELSSFDYICLLKDLENTSSDPPLKDSFLSEHCFSSLLFSKQYVQNIIGLFQKHSRLGLLMPFLPMFAEWPERILNEEWGSGRERAERIYSMLQLTVPFDDHPVVPCGGMFWIRGGAMSAFYRHDWAFGDFRLDKKTDNISLCDTLLRIYPMLVQESGFFSVCICPAELAGFNYANAYFNLLKYSALKISPGSVHFSDVRKVLRLYLKRKLRKILTVR